MSDNPRDTHFQGFARLLIEDMDKVHALRMDIVQPELERIIARRAYDLMYHYFEYVHKHTGNGIIPDEVNEYIKMIPDMTAWPKEEQ